MSCEVFCCTVSMMATYCRITGKSRGLPKPHYFPLLPPISPADAKRLCRITGKSHGLPTHHYIPVLTTISKQSHRKTCKITTKSDGLDHHHFQPVTVKHIVREGFRYLIPVLDMNPEVLQVLEGKKNDENGHKYIYTVDQRRCTLVLPGKMEAAVRDGDIRDIMLDKHADRLLLKLCKGKSIEVDVKDICVEGMELYEGEGPVQSKRKKYKIHDGNDWRRKIFEDKEKLAELEENRISEIKSKRIKVKLDALHSAICSWKNVRTESPELHINCEFDDKVENVILRTRSKLVLDSFVKVSGTPLVSSLPQPIKIESQNVDLSRSLPGIIQQPATTGETMLGLPVAKVITPFEPFVAELDLQIENALKELNFNKSTLQVIFEKQASVQQKHMTMLPTVEDILATSNSIRKLMEKGTCHSKYKFEQGVKITIGNVERYVPGQFVPVASGEVFVPGNVLETLSGLSFVPGFALQAEHEPKFLPGCVFKDTDNSSFFVAGQMALTRDGEKFVQGQVICTSEGTRFMPGQTIITNEGLRFVPGQVVRNEKFESGFKFLPGQIVMTPEGPQFVTGHFSLDSANGICKFIAGQSILNENCNWEFVSGQDMKTLEGHVFVAGKEIVDKDGHRHFVPGQMVIEEGKVERFVPGITVVDETGNLHFMPGIEVETANGVKFIEGMIIEQDNVMSFAAGRAVRAENNSIEFHNLQTADDLVLHDVKSDYCVPVMVSRNEVSEVFGQLVQSEQGVEFFPGEAAGLPAGKVIPGRLVKGKEMRFIPGIMVEKKFVPGQFVTTETEEKFVPGQVIETNNGPKFVPGEVFQTRSGPKFVPGQTMETDSGSKFIPGQIIETKRGATFIPGQVIFTEEEGLKFVPGQVVETVEGPRFVPGRVVETGDHVTFIPGQIVETEEGLKFIAPDLEDDPEGGYQFTVQGFEVTQEELRMIGNNSIPHACFIGEMAVDSRTLQQLAEAGMAVGRQLPVDIPSVNIRSLPVTEAACRIADDLNIDPSYSVKMSRILSNLQQIRQANVAILKEDVEDENLNMLLYIVQESDHDKESVEFLHTIGNSLENVVKVDLEQKLNTINTLHASTTELASKVRERNHFVCDISCQIAKKLDLHSSSSIKIAQILSNLQQIKNANIFISRKDIKDKKLKMLLNLASDCSGDIDEVELLQSLGIALESTIKVDPQCVLETIDTLHRNTRELVSNVRNIVQPVIGSAYTMVNNLGIDASNSVKLCHILFILQKIKKANIAFPFEAVQDNKLQILLNIVGTSKTEENSAELMQTLISALENTINLDPDHKQETIDMFHTLTTHLSSQVESTLQLITETATQIATNLNVNEEYTGKLSKIITHLLQIKYFKLRPLKKDVTEENLRNLINVVMECDSVLKDVDLLQTLGKVLESEINMKPESKLQKIDAMNTSTSALASKLLYSLEQKTETAIEIAKIWNFNPSYVMKIIDILSNLQQIKSTGVTLKYEEIRNESLELLLSLISTCDVSKSQTVKKLSNALQKIMKVNPNQKLLMVDTLYVLTTDLVVQILEKSVLVDHIACDISERMNVDKTQSSAKLGQILLNLDQITQSNISLANECIENPSLKTLLETVVGNCSNLEDTAFFQVASIALENSINTKSEDKLEVINALQTVTDRLVSKANNKSQLAAESACGIAATLKIDIQHVVKVSHILLNLEQVKESNIAISNEVLQDEKLQFLLNLTLASCNKKGESEVMRKLTDDLEKTISIDAEEKLNTIDVLHQISAYLISHVQKKSHLLKETACKVANKLGVNEAHSLKLSNILSNLQQIKLNHTGISVDNIKDENLKALVLIVSEGDIHEKEEIFLHKMAIFLEKALNYSPEMTLQNIDRLQALTADFVSDIRDRSKLAAEAAYVVANDLSVNTQHLMKISQILINLQQIRQANVSIFSSNMKDENLELLLNLALECNMNADDAEIMATLAGVLKSTIQSDLDHKNEAILSLHELTLNAASEARNEAQLIKKGAYNIISKLGLDEAEAVKVNQILLNLQQIVSTSANICMEEIRDKNLKTLVSTILNYDISRGSAKFLHDAETGLLKIINLCPLNKSAIINSLQKLTSEIILKTQKRSLLTAKIASTLASDLNMHIPHLIKISHTMLNLHQIKQSNFGISVNDVTDENVELLLNLALTCDTKKEDSEITASLSAAFQKTINFSSDKSLTVDTLHELTFILASKAKENSQLVEKTAFKIASRLDIDEAHRIKLGQILSNLLQLKSSKVSIAKEDVESENFKTLINTVLKYNVHEANDKFLQKVSIAVEKVIKMDPGDKLQNIDSLHTLTINIISKIRKIYLLTAETACTIANELQLNIHHLVKVKHILSNLQQIEELNLATTGKNMLDENFELLLNFASPCIRERADVEAMQILVNALNRTIKFNLEAKFQTINALHKLTTDVASKMYDKIELIEKTARHIANQLNLNGIYVTKIAQILSNLQRIKLSNVDIFRDSVEEEATEILLKAMADCEIGEDEAEYFKAIGTTLQNIIKLNLANTQQIINLLYKVTTNIVVRMQDVSLLITERAAEVADHFGLNTSQLVSMMRILSNLYQIKQSNVAISEENIPNQTAELLLNLALGGDFKRRDSDVIRSLADALQTTLEFDSDGNVSVIESLQQMISSLAIHTRKKLHMTEKIACNLMSNLNCDNGSKMKLTQILSNFLLLKVSNIDIFQKDIGNAFLKNLIKTALNCEYNKEDYKFVKAVALEVEKAINEDPLHTMQNIDSLHALTTNLARNIRDQTLLTTELASTVANNFNMNTSFVTKISHILLNMYEIKQSNLLIRSKDIPNENSELLFKLALACDNKQDDKQAIHTLVDAFQKIIIFDSDNKSEIIDEVYEFIVNLVWKVRAKSNMFEKSACQIANKFGIDDAHMIKLYQILSNLQKIISQNIDLSKENIKNKTLKLLIETIKGFDDDVDDVKFLIIIGSVLENVINASSENKFEEIDTLHELTYDLASKTEIQSLIIIERAYDVASDWKLDTIHLIQINHILTNLLLIQRLGLINWNADVLEENMELLLNFALSVGKEINDVSVVQALVNALQKTLKGTSENITHIVESLHKSTMDLTVKARFNLHLAEATAHKIANKWDFTDVQSAKLCNIILNIAQIKKANFDISVEDIVDENLKKFLIAMVECDGIGKSKTLSALEVIIHNMIEMNLDRKRNSVDSMYSLTNELVSKVRDRSLLIAETAYNLANQLNLDTPYLVKVIHILSHLQRIKQSHGAISVKFGENDKLELLLNLALLCDSSKENAEMIHTLADIFEKTINIEPEQKLETIDNLHHYTSILSETMYKKSKLINEVGLNVAQNLNVGEAYAHKLSNILSNLEQMKLLHLDMNRYAIKNENWNQVIDLALHSDMNIDEALMYESLGSTLQRAIRAEPEHKLLNIDSLLALTERIISNANNKTLLISQTALVIANDLNVNTSQLMKMSAILSNLLEVKQAHIGPLIDEIKDEKLQVLLNLTLACNKDENEEQIMKVLASALKNTITVESEKKHSTVDSLHALTANLVVTTHEKLQLISESACQVAKRLNLDKTRTIKIHELLSNLQQIKLLSADISKEDIQDDDVKRLVEYVTYHNGITGDVAMLQQLGDIIQNIVSENPQNKEESIDSLHASVISLGEKLRSRFALLTECAMHVAQHLNLNTPEVIKMCSILSCVRQIKQSSVAISNNEIQDANVKLLLNLTEDYGNSNDDTSYMQKLKDVLENTIKVDSEHKKQTVSTLHVLTIDLAAKVSEKSVELDKMVRGIARKCNLDECQSLKVSQILTNLQRIIEKNIFFGDELFEDENLKSLLITALKFKDIESRDLIEILSNALESTLKFDPQHKLRIINKLHKLSQELSHIKVKKSLIATKAAYVAAENLNLDASQIIKLSEILLNLQQISESDVIVATDYIKNEKIKLLIYLAQVSNTKSSNTDFIYILGAALEKIIKLNSENKLQTIEVLHAIADDLVATVIRTSSLIQEIAHNVARRLNLDSVSTLKIRFVLTKFLQIKHTNIEFSYENVENEHLKKLLSLALDCDGDTDDKDFLLMLSDALENISKFDPNYIDVLHSTTVDFFSKVTYKSLLAAETAWRVVNNVNVEVSHVISVSQILSNLKLLKSFEPFISKENIKDENLKILVNFTLLNGYDVDSSEFLFALADAVENTVKINTEHKIELLNAIHSQTNSLILGAQEKAKQNNKTASEIARKTKTDASKVTLILSNLEQLRNLSCTLSSDCVKDKNLKVLLNILSEYGSDHPRFLDKIANTLEEILRTNPQHKLQILSTLCILTSKLVSEARDKSLLVAEAACDTAKKMNLSSCVVNVGHILSSLQKIKQSGRLLLPCDIQNDDLKRLVDVALILEGDSYSPKFIRALGQALSNSVQKDEAYTSETIDEFRVLTDELIAKIKKRSELIEGTANKVANKLLLDKSIIRDILLNLEQIKSSKIASENIENVDVKMLFNIASEYGYSLEDTQFFKVLGDAIENIFNLDPECKSEKINTLHVTTSNLTIKARNDSLLTARAALQVTEQLNMDQSYAVNISHILSNLQQIKELGAAVSVTGFTDNNLKNLLQEAFLISGDKTEAELISELTEIVKKVVNIEGTKNKLRTIQSLCSFTTAVLIEVREKPPNKIQLLKNIIKNKFELKEDVVKKLSSILDENEMTVCVAFQHMSNANPDFVNKVLYNAADILKDESGDEKKAVDTLHRAIVRAVAETSEQTVTQTLNKNQSEDFRSLVIDAIGLAKALGMNEVVVMLNGILNDKNSMPILAKDKIVMEVLQRLTVMRQLADKQPYFKNALRDLQCDPYAARNDPRLRELVRESAVLMVIPEESLVLRSSADIPSSLLLGDNSLAVEDFMVKSRQTGRTFLILKKGVQMVLPREAARDVLTGKVPYTVLDENGIQYFTPLHVFNALNLPRVATNRFSNYGYSPRITKPKHEDCSDLFSRFDSMNLDDLRKNLPNGSCSTQEVNNTLQLPILKYCFFVVSFCSSVVIC